MLTFSLMCRAVTIYSILTGINSAEILWKGSYEQDTEPANFQFWTSKDSVDTFSALLDKPPFNFIALIRATVYEGGGKR